MRKDAPGFSLIECVIGMAVVALLCGLALPSFQQALRHQRGASAMHLLTAQLAQARSTAIMRRVPVTLCPSQGDGRCSTSQDWSDGWIVYRDPARSDHPGSREDILAEVRQPIHASVRILSSSSRTRVRYQPDGRSAGTNLTLRICQDGQLGGQVILNNVGRTRSTRPTAPLDCNEASADG